MSTLKMIISVALMLAATVVSAAQTPERHEARDRTATDA